MRLISLLSVIVLLAACDGSGTDTRGSQAGGPIALPSGEVENLTLIDLTIGDGDPVQRGDTAIVHYTGWLYDPEAGNRRGLQFDTSRGRATFNFQVGAGQVIEGWDEGVAGMRVGGRRYLFVPPDWGYGEGGAAGGTIPPNATLVFEVELVEIVPLP